VSQADRNTPQPPAATARLHVVAGTVLAALTLLALAPSAASAAQLHAFSSAFGSPGSGAGQLLLKPSTGLNVPGSGLAVNIETGDVYVADTANHRIDEFDPSKPPSEQFIRSFGWEVNATTPEAKLQTCTTASDCRAGSSGSEPGQLETPVFVAVDNSCALHEPPLSGFACESFDPSAGDLYVADVGDHLVTKFDADGGLAAAWGNNGLGSTPNGQLNGSGTKLFGAGLVGITVDHSGDLAVLDEAANGSFFEFDPDGTFVESVNLEHPPPAAPEPQGLAVDSAGDFYFSRVFEEILKYAPGGSRLGVVLSQTRTSGIALNPVTDDLYVGERTGTIAVVSRQCEPNALTGCPPAQSFGSAHLSEPAGLAVAPDGTLYAASTGTNQIAVFKVSLEANIQAPTAIEGTSAVLHGTVNPEGTPVTSCHFQFGSTKTYGGNLSCLDEAGDPVGTELNPLTGNSPIALHAPLEGLQAGTTYHYRLRARNTASPLEEIHSEDEKVETKVLPRIEAEEATEVTASSATLEAKINPLGPAVNSCQVEWGITTSYENTPLSCEPASLPGGSSPVAIVAHLTELSPETTYHWRIAATDVNGTQRSPDNTFVYLPGPPSAEVSQECGNESLREANGSTALPDCRAYEQVTPPRRNGSLLQSQLFPTSLGFAVSADGSRLFASTLDCFAAAQSCTTTRGGVTGNGYELSRTSSGWSATPLTPPATQFSAANLVAANVETASEIFGLALPAPPSLEAREWFYVRHADGSFEPIGPVASGPGIHGLSYEGGIVATADLSHLVYPDDGAPFWPAFDQTVHRSIYEYAGPAEHPFLVAVSGGQGSTELIGTCGSALANRSSGAPRALSADGRTVYFGVEPCAGGIGKNVEVEVPVNTLYARIDGESADARTVKISGPAPEPQCDAACQAQPPAQPEFEGASADGSLAYFLSTQQLTNEASEDSRSGDHAENCTNTSGANGCNLYLYRDPQQQPLTGDHLVDVSAGDTSGQGPQVQGVMAISQDGRRVYFVAKGLLAGANVEGNEPLEGGNNLYLYDVAEEKTRFIATLSAANCGFEKSDCQQWAPGPATANVTSDGRFLLFTSRVALTPDATRPEGPAQVYRYDAQSERLNRVSIGQRGFDDNGNAAVADAGIVPPETTVQAVAGDPSATPSISADGRRAFFQSPTGLTPGALNDIAVNTHGGLAENVYEWQEDGTGSCEEAAGCLYLISDGRDVTAGPPGNFNNFSSVELIGTDPSGENVFFTTADPLVPTDTDTQRDIYDARVKGGFAPPPTPIKCEGDACKAEGTQAGPEQSPNTPNFNGPPEGPNHPQGPPKHHKKKHAKKHKKPHRHKRANVNRRASR